MCDKHQYFKNGESHTKKVYKMSNKNGDVFCPICAAQESTRQLEKEVQASIDQAEAARAEANKPEHVLLRKSIVPDQELLSASFDNYITDCQETASNLERAKECFARYKDNQIFNIFFQGKQGAGKSHLAYSILRAINDDEQLDKSSLFVSVEEMIRLMKDSFRDKESKYTERYFIDLLASVDYLVLDDIGAETGAIDSEKQATDFVQRILYAVLTKRQHTSTIITTNLNKESIFNMYDKKLVSRMLKRPKYIIFNNAKDRRKENIPF
jgi:DNA replication protein DnaC